MPVELDALGRAVKRVQHRHHRALDAALAAVGTTLVQWDALRAVARNPGSSAHDLAVETFQSDQAFGTLVNRLAAQGLIERRSGRGRRIDHYLTLSGERTLEAGRPIADDVLRSSFVDLSDEERATLLDLLSRLAGEHLS